MSRTTAPQAVAKDKKTAKKGNKIRLVVSFVMLIYFVWTVTAQQVEIWNGKKQLKAINVQVAIEQTLQEELQLKKELVNTPEYMEQLARTQLGYARPDEIVFFDATSKN